MGAFFGFFLYVGAIWSLLGGLYLELPPSYETFCDAHVAILFPPISKACANTYFELYAAWSHLDLRIEYCRPTLITLKIELNLNYNCTIEILFRHCLIILYAHVVYF